MYDLKLPKSTGRSPMRNLREVKGGTMDVSNLSTGEKMLGGGLNAASSIAGVDMIGANPNADDTNDTNTADEKTNIKFDENGVYRPAYALPNSAGIKSVFDGDGDDGFVGDNKTPSIPRPSSIKSIAGGV